MVNQALFEQFLQLDAEERREFVRAAQATVDDDVPADVLAEIDRRLAQMGPEPASDYVTLDELRNEIAERRARRTA
ncbi:MAG TPA: hypothetical protein PK781_05100 [Terrimesophilobacter sp.]|nr:hypothetical protein [Terrimesophilobacter sp.]HRP99821.1 hypothetical protein [Terrimesophilobacter sp.]